MKAKKYTMWKDVDYWNVCDDSDKELFRGTRSQCRRFAGKRDGMHVYHVIMERDEAI